jgi:DNA-binding transcriptional ArsR family regulator
MSAGAEPLPRHNGRMTQEATGIARLAAALADETRATMLLALLDGRAFTAGELARRAGVAPSTASEHLDRLLAAGLLSQRRQGRHRYVQLADAETAHLVEDLVARAGTPAIRPLTTLRAASAREALARGRTCYDHLAGRLGVDITDAMTAAGLLSQRTGFSVTDAGCAWLVDRAGVDPAALRASRRPLARPCLDWTERRTHLGGAAGAALCARFLGARWVERIGSGRAVRLTDAGERALAELLGLAAR